MESLLGRTRSHVRIIDYKETMSELTEKCPNQDVLIDNFLAIWTRFHQFGHFFVNNPSIRTC